MAAERELQVARATDHRKGEAEEELDAFYKKVLPANVSAARSLTYVPVVEIARRNDVNYVNRVYEDPEELHPEDSRRLGVSLKRLTTRVVLQGDYESIRAFIYELEQAPQFVVIDQVTLLEAEEGEPVTLTVTLVDLLPGVECSLIAAGKSCWRCWSPSSPSLCTGPGRGRLGPPPARPTREARRAPAKQRQPRRPT